MPERDEERALTYPKVDHALTIMLFGLVVMTCRLLPFDDLLHVGGYLLATVLAINVSKKTCLWLAPKIGTAAAMEKRRNAQKFADQGWQLVIHTSMSALELYILYEDDWKMWNEPTEGVWDYCGRNPPASCVNALAWGDKTYTVLPSIRALYLAQIAIWGCTAISHRFLEARRKDYFTMYLHHIVTLSLLLGSYVYDIHKVGVLVVFLHDCSDILVDCVKMMNYLDLDRKSGTFLVEFFFSLNLVTFPLFRLYHFPSKVIASCLSRRACVWGGEDPELGPWRLLSNPACVWCTSLRLGMIILLLMHVYWYSLFLRILRNMIKGTDAHDAAGDEYEGASSDSEAEEAKTK